MMPVRPQTIVLLVCVAATVYSAESRRIVRSADGGTVRRQVTLVQDRPSTMRIPSKYNEEHPECIVRAPVSNIPDDTEEDSLENIWSWTVHSATIISNVFAPHWGLVFEVRPPLVVNGVEPRFVAIQRVLDWDNEAKTLHKPCNHAELSIQETRKKADQIAGNHKMVSYKMSKEVHQRNGSAYKVRDIPRYTTAIMSSAVMAEPFSWWSNNCRDFVRHFSMNFGIIQDRSTLWGFNETFTTRDYLDPELRKVCNEQASNGHKEPCFCKSQTGWSWVTSCSNVAQCSWDEMNLECVAECSHADNQNKVNCENGQFGDCVWQDESCVSKR